MDDIEGQVVLITGAGGGLGAALVRRFARRNARVALGVRPAERPVAEGLVEELGTDRALVVDLDVTDEAQWRAAVDDVGAAFGPVAILVNNAALFVGGRFEELAPADMHRVLQTNLIGPWLGMRAVAPVMRRAGGGSIVNVNSTAGLGGAPGLTAYATSKWALRGLTRVAAKDLAADGIRVNGVHPGIIDTPFADDPRTGLPVGSVEHAAIPRRATPDEIARYVVFVACDASFSTGTEVVADGGALLGPV